MAEKTFIEWTNYKGNPGSTWNIFTGCSKVSQGCKYCYAERWAIRGMGQFAKDRSRKFTDIMFHEDKLTDPVKWKRPRMIFVCSMSDLFHEQLEYTTIDMIYEIMIQAPQHIYLVLTKRPDRMREYYSRLTNVMDKAHIWVGTSAEDQKTYLSRSRELIQVPARVRFISAEPLLGLIDLYEPVKMGGYYVNPLSKIDWIIAGGESGPKARPSHPDWIRQLRNQSVQQNVPFFFKQWGEWIDSGNIRESNLSDYKTPETTARFVLPGHSELMDCAMFRLGKKRSGRLLDGREWIEFPDDARDHFEQYPWGSK